MLNRNLVEALADRDRIRRHGWTPGPDELDGAPVLTDWILGSDPADPRLLALVGTVTGHPNVADGKSCLTSAVVEIDRENRAWARTVNRWYRLGSQRWESVQ